MRLPVLPAFGVLEITWLQAVGILAFGWYTWPGISDVDLYFTVSGRILHGEFPYRDVPLEYPPLALVPFMVPRLVTLGHSIGLQDYYGLVLALNVVWTTLTAMCVAAIGKRACGLAATPGLGENGNDLSRNGPVAGLPRNPLVSVAIYAGLALIIAPNLAWRYDAFPALLTALSLLAVVSNRPALAGVWLGLGTVAKIYPMFLVGLFAAYYLATGERRKCVFLIAASVGAAAAVMLPFWLVAPDQWLSFLTYHRERGFEMGSTVAAALWLGDIAGLGHASIVHNYGAAHIVSPVAQALLSWIAPAMLVAVGAAVLLYLERFARERERTGTVSLQTLACGATVVLLAFLIVNKVFSPQYIVWLLPFAPFLPWRAVALVALIAALTDYVHPFAWVRMLNGSLVPTLALNLRNALVVVLIFMLWFSRPRAMVAA